MDNEDNEIYDLTQNKIYLLCQGAQCILKNKKSNTLEPSG